MKHRGFTIIELIVVIGLIAILLTVTAVGYSVIQNRSRDSKRQADIAALKDGLERYYRDNGNYPADDTARGGSTGFSAGGKSLTAATTRLQAQSLFSNLNQNFGDPRGSGEAIFNQTATPSYIYIGGYTATQAVDTTRSVSYAWPRASQTCTYRLQLSAGQTSSYILGYYNEESRRIDFITGERGVNLTWPTDNAAQPNCVPRG